LADRLAKVFAIDVPDVGIVVLTMFIGLTTGEAGNWVGMVMAIYVAKAKGRALVAIWTTQIDALPFPQAV
jgi:hypothetical protein